MEGRRREEERESLESSVVYNDSVSLQIHNMTQKLSEGQERRWNRR